ncbi:MAG: hypothetical protein JWM98_2516 [Thermoleophilia bacterium]|nr:hypothetical protein [Thermoleophilia bacterium]
MNLLQTWQPRRTVDRMPSRTFGRSRRPLVIALLLGAISIVASGCSETSATQPTAAGFGKLVLKYSVCPDNSKRGCTGPQELPCPPACGPTTTGLTGAERETAARELQTAFDGGPANEPVIIKQAPTETQELLSYRLDDDLVAPATVTVRADDKAGTTYTFSRDDQYSEELELLAPSAADDRWVGYVADKPGAIPTYEAIVSFDTEALGLVNSTQAYVSSGSRQVPVHHGDDPVLCDDIDTDEAIVSALSEDGLDGVDGELRGLVASATTCLDDFQQEASLSALDVEGGEVVGNPDAPGPELNDLQLASTALVDVNTAKLTGPATPTKVVQGASAVADLDLGTARPDEAKQAADANDVNGDGGDVVPTPAPDVIPVTLAATTDASLTVSLDPTVVDAPRGIIHTAVHLSVSAGAAATPGLHTVHVTLSAGGEEFRSLDVPVTVVARAVTPVVGTPDAGGTPTGGTPAGGGLAAAPTPPGSADAPVSCARPTARFVHSRASVPVTNLGDGGFVQQVYASTPSTMFGTLLIPVPPGSAAARAGHKYYVAVARLSSRRAGTFPLVFSLTPNGVKQLRSSGPSRVVPARMAVVVQRRGCGMRFIKRVVQVTIPALEA